MSNNNNDETVKIDNLPTTTAHQSRLQIFQPTRKPTMQTRQITTQWGTAKIIGKIGQGHADVLEAIFRESDRFRVLDDGSAQILVDPYKVRITACGGEYKLSKQRLDEIMIDLIQTVIDMSIPNKEFSIDMGSLITKAQNSVINAKTTKGRFGVTNRKLWRIDIGEHFVRLIEKDIHLYYDPKPISKLKSGVSQAVARHLLTHHQPPNGGWIIDSIIKAVGAGETSKAMWERRNEIFEDEDGLRNLGFEIKEGRILKVEVQKT